MTLRDFDDQTRFRKGRTLKGLEDISTGGGPVIEYDELATGIRYQVATAPQQYRASQPDGTYGRFMYLEPA